MYFEKRQKSHHHSIGLIEQHYPSKRMAEAAFLEKLNEEPQNVPRAIYVHTPYCDKICSFCNLNREQVNENLESYADYIVSEFKKYGQYKYFSKPFDVMFFGGGTPTIYKEHQLKKIFEAIKENIVFAKDYEFTLETTLHNLNDAKIELFNTYGINRLSIGIQTFNDEGRIFYNRTYKKDEVISRLKKLRENFNGQICIDIIYNYPGQTVESAIDDAKIIKELGLDSSSFYSLMVHQGSALSKDIEEDKVRLQEDLAREKELYLAFKNELLKDENYYTLELTKVARKGGDKYKYIQTRNLGGDTFPIGRGAGGNVGNVGVFRMTPEMSGHMEKDPYQVRLNKVGTLFQFPTIEKKSVENLLLENEINDFREIMDELIGEGFFTEDETSFKLTEDGMFWGNNISIKILTHLTQKTLDRKN